MKETLKWAAIDFGSVAAASWVLAHIGAPWWAYPAILAFGIVQRHVGYHIL